MFYLCEGKTSKNILSSSFSGLAVNKLWSLHLFIFCWIRLWTLLAPVYRAVMLAEDVKQSSVSLVSHFHSTKTKPERKNLKEAFALIKEVTVWMCRLDLRDTSLLYKDWIPLYGSDISRLQPCALWFWPPLIYLKSNLSFFNCVYFLCIHKIELWIHKSVIDRVARWPFLRPILAFLACCDPKWLAKIWNGFFSENWPFWLFCPIFGLIYWFWSYFSLEMLNYCL